MKKIFVLILTIFVNTILFGQGAKEIGVLPIPNKFNDYVYERDIKRYYEGESLDMVVKEADVDVPWIVYSDRNKNKYRDYPNGGTKGTLGIAERLHVFAVQGNWLQVGWVSRKDRQWVKEIKGWVKADQLVLSPYAVLGKSGGPKKGMILTSVSSFNPDDDLSEI